VVQRRLGGDHDPVPGAAHLHAQIGGYVGQALPRIGLSWGILLGAVRHLAWGPFVVADKKVFTGYRRSIKIAKKSFLNLNQIVFLKFLLKNSNYF
jgi:hypothetical protein